MSLRDPAGEGKPDNFTARDKGVYRVLSRPTY